MPSFGLQIIGPLDRWIAGLATMADDMVGGTGRREWEKATKRVFDRSQQVVHVITGELKRSGRWEVRSEGDELEAVIVYEAEHAVYEHAYGGEHAFLQRAWEDEGDQFDDALGETFDQVVSRWR